MPRATQYVAALLAVVGLSTGAAGQTELGGDGRFYQTFMAERVADQPRHAELGIARLTMTSWFGEALRFEAHGTVSVAAPGFGAGGTSVAGGGTRRFFKLEYRFIDEEDLQGVAEIDRLNLRWEHDAFRLVAGRQSMSWGVSYFWPALDLFAPFPPYRIDREYKPGIDALRLTVPLGALSEVEVVGAGQGRSFPEDFSLGGLGRFHLGRADLGLMAGRFHTDDVVGAFAAVDASGTGLRFEAAFTHSGDERDAELGRERFWRGSVGLDRQLTAGLMLSAELAFNGFGSEDVADYPELAAADRVRRGEVNGLGRHYAGLSLAWRAHPLILVSNVVLLNWSDGSTLLQSFAEWSASETVVVMLGGAVGLGPGVRPDGQPGSEYGAVPVTLYGAIRAYF